MKKPNKDINRIQNLKNKVISLLLLTLITSAPLATAADIPLLTWERGRIQEVVVGGGAVENNWAMTLEGMGITPMPFTRSNEASSGYAIFSIQLPDDLPIGGGAAGGWNIPKLPEIKNKQVEPTKKNNLPMIIGVVVIGAILYFFYKKK